MLQRLNIIANHVLQRSVKGFRQGVISAVAAFAAYIPAHWAGFEQSFWSALTAIAVVQAEFRDSESNGRKQILGALIGGSVGLAFSLCLGIHLWVYAITLVISVLLCWAFLAADAAQIAGSTATIILLVPHGGSATEMLVSRLSEVGWGAAIGLAVAFVDNTFVRRIWK